MGALKTTISFLGGAVAAAGAIAGVLALGVREEVPDSNVAEGFIRQYFATAPRDAAASWAMLTPGYTEERMAKPRDPLTKENYREYFAQYSEITVDNVRPSVDLDGWFRADITYKKPGSKDSTSRQIFQLACPARTRYPFVTCDKAVVQINRVVFEDLQTQTRTEDTGKTVPSVPAPECPRINGECETFLTVEPSGAAFVGPAGAWQVDVLVVNGGDYPTRRCEVTDRAGTTTPFSLQASGERTLSLLLESDPPEEPQSVDAPAPPPGDVIIRMTCANVRDLPSSLRIGPTD